MSIPFLPLEIIVAIIDHLAADLHGKERVENGRNLSLVSRSFRRPGQGLVWKVISMDPASEFASRIFELCSSNPHLPPLVQHLTLEPNVQPSTEEEDQQVLAISLFLARQCLNLKTFSNYPAGLHPQTFNALSKLSSLHSLGFRLWELDLNSVAYSLITGFVNLFHLTFDVLSVPDSPSLDNLAALPSRRSPVQLVEITAEADQLGLVSEILNLALDKKQLQECRIFHSLHADILNWLSTTSSLTRLTVVVPLPLLVEFLPQMISVLPTLINLGWFVWGLPASATSEEFTALPSPSSLQSFLAALPRSVRFAHIPRLSFELVPSTLQTLEGPLVPPAQRRSTSFIGVVVENDEVEGKLWNGEEDENGITTWIDEPCSLEQPTGEDSDDSSEGASTDEGGSENEQIDIDNDLQDDRNDRVSDLDEE